MHKFTQHISTYNAHIHALRVVARKANRQSIQFTHAFLPQEGLVNMLHSVNPRELDIILTSSESTKNI